MPNIFSEDLISRLKKYFKDRYGQDITTEESVVFLSSFAELYLKVGNVDANSQAPKAREWRP